MRLRQIRRQLGRIVSQYRPGAGRKRASGAGAPGEDVIVTLPSALGWRITIPITEQSIRSKDVYACFWNQQLRELPRLAERKHEPPVGQTGHASVAGTDYAGAGTTGAGAGVGAGTYEHDIKHPVDSAEVRAPPAKSGSIGDRVGAKIEQGAGMLGGMIHGINRGKDRFNEGLDNSVSHGGRSWEEKNRDMVRGLNQGIDNAAGTASRAAHEGYHEPGTASTTGSTTGSTGSMYETKQI
ncbi:unnamed protein product [Peniophora sp. CBMAI 1063]|nr:unnamed protein product [Peniophora sp. CBMAI 1063]